MAFNQQLSVLGQVAPATTGTAGQVLVSAGSSASSYWASAIPVSAYSAQFNGSSQYLTIPSSASVTSNFTFGSSDFTIESWIYPTTGYSGGDIFGKRASGSVYSAINLGIASSSGLKATIIGSTTGSSWDVTYTVGSINIPLNAWTHIALARNGSNFRVFVNGVLDFTVTNSGALYTESSNAVAIGSSTADGSAKFQGYLSNYRIVKGVAVYTGAFTVPTSPLGTAQAAGTNITAVTPSQVSLLTCNGTGFTDSSPNAFALTNNGNAVTSQFAPFSSFSAISRSATQTQTILTSGSGTYYPPSGVAWLRIRMIGGGGGGAGGGSGGSGAGGFGSAGGSTTFGTSLLTAGGGGGGVSQGTANPAGGTATIGSGATGITLVGASGTASPIAGLYSSGASGAASPFGSGGGGGYATSFGGSAAPTNSGAGGGGGGSYTNSGANTGGGGGGAGGYIEAFISILAASYAYSIGTGGGGGTAASGGFAGGGGGSGLIIVEENYAVNASGGNYSASYLIVAGGGSGGFHSSGNGGGGGGGGYIASTIYLVLNTSFAVTIGAGAATAPSATVGNNGNISSAFGLTAVGGGGGGTYLGVDGTSPGASGGSGGGGGQTSSNGGAGTSGQGNAGGNSGGIGGGGGGGAAAAGSVSYSTSGREGGYGGAGLNWQSLGTFYSGGGAGSSHSSATAGVPQGGAGGGGNGHYGATAGVAGTANRGGGGGGGGENVSAGAGGSGVVVISYVGSTRGSGGTITSSGGYTYHTFTTSGTYTA